MILRTGRARALRSIETKTTGTDMVTDIDRASEKLIVGRLADARPDDGVLGEEGSTRPSKTGVEWVIDPVDGTTNYLYGFPSFAVSIAARRDGATIAGAVHDPTHDETFVAARGHGATINGEPLTMGEGPPLASALVSTGFAYRPDRRGVQASLLPYVLPRVRDIRRTGAASLDLCWVALGRVDAYFEWGLAPWDWAAASLVVEEAGGRVIELPGGTVVAAAPRLAEALVELLAEAGLDETLLA